MVTLLLLSGCLINTDLYAERLAELRAGDDDSGGRDSVVEDSAGDTDTHADSGTDDTGCTPVSVWADADGDGYGNPDFSDERCPAEGWVANADDCDDGEAGVNPGAEEVCGTGVDEDCDGAVGECRWEGAVSVEDADAAWIADGSSFGIPASLGDLDGDGSAEIAIVTDARVYLTGNPGDGEHLLADIGRSIRNDSTEGFRFYRVARTDLDADGTGELVTVSLADAPIGPTWLHWHDPAVAGDTSTLDARASIASSESERSFGFAIAAGDDLTGDGWPELVVSDLTLEGTSYVALHQATGGTLDVASPVALLTGEPGDALGYATASGDADGDGTPDLVVTAPAAEGGRGAVYVFSGPVVGDHYVDAADTVVVGAEVEDNLGISLVFAPILDADGDGDPDLLASAWGASPGVSEGGAAYLFTGPLGSRLDPSDAVGSFLGAHADAGMGWAVGSAGDCDGDARSDVLLGAHPADSADSTGRAYVIYGPASGSYLESELPVTFEPESGDSRLGTAPLGVGDLDGDSLADVLLIDPRARADLGAAYLIRGGGP